MPVEAASDGLEVPLPPCNAPLGTGRRSHGVVRIHDNLFDEDPTTDISFGYDNISSTIGSSGYGPKPVLAPGETVVDPV